MLILLKYSIELCSIISTMVLINLRKYQHLLNIQISK